MRAAMSPPVHNALNGPKPCATSAALRVLGLLMTAAAFAQAAQAQDSARGMATRPSALAGVVSDTAGHPISGAVVLADGFGKSVTSDDSGRFHLAGLVAGKNGFTVRKIGFLAVSFETSLAENSTLVVNVRLRTATELAPAVVTAEKELSVRKQLTRDIEYRKTLGIARFMDSTLIDKRHTLNGVLTEVPNFRVQGSRILFGRCEPIVFIDGRQTDQGELREFNLDNIGMLETYSHATGIPNEFLTRKRGPTCGVIVVWSKQRLP
jgi:hypothetical protein